MTLVNSEIQFFEKMVFLLAHRTCRQILLFSLILFNTSVFALPTIQLSTDAVAGGEEIFLEASGGSPPYIWFTEAGSLEQTSDDGKTATLTAPQVAGDFYLTLRDSQNIDTKTLFQVSWQKFSVTPEYVYAEPGQTITFGIHGVTSNVKVIEDAGEYLWLPESSGVGIRYTAPDKPDFYTITFYQEDNPGDTRLAHVKVYAPLEALEPEVFLEDYEEQMLQVKGGVPPYIWIEGGKGQLEPQGRDRDRVRYTPGEIIGLETLTVYDSTNSSVNIRVTVKGLFRLSPNIHSVCLDKNPIVKFVASGGEAPYSLTPPSQGGWRKVAETPNSITLQFTESDFFETVGSDNSGETNIASVEVDAICDECILKLEPSEPVYLYIQEQNPKIDTVTISVNDKTAGQVDWLCQGACDTEDLSTTQGKIVTFFTPGLGHYELIAQDRSECTGILEVHVANNLLSLYSGADKKLDAIEMQRALDDFFEPIYNYSSREFYYLAACYLYNECDG